MKDLKNVAQQISEEIIRLKGRVPFVTEDTIPLSAREVLNLSWTKRKQIGAAFYTDVKLDELSSKFLEKILENNFSGYCFLQLDVPPGIDKAFIYNDRIFCCRITRIFNIAENKLVYQIDTLFQEFNPCLLTENKHGP